MYKTLATGPIGVEVDMRRAAELAALNGFQGLAVGRAQIEQAGGVAVAAQILSDAGLSASNADLPVNFRSDQGTFLRDLEALSEYADDLATLGCNRVITWLLPASDAMPFDENMALHVERLGAIAEALEQRDIRLGLEYVGPRHMRVGKKYPFVWNQSGLFDLVARIGQPNVGILLDSYHWYTSGGDAHDLAELDNDAVVLVHVNDAPKNVPIADLQDQVRCMPGETGVIDMGAFMGALVDIAYDGPVMVEPFSDWVRSLSPEEAVRATYESLVRIWPKA